MSKTCPKKGYSRRFEQHKKAASDGNKNLVYSAWRKHGEPSFEVLSVHADRASCAEAEIAAIAEHGSISDGKGYNIMGGGEGQQAGQNPRLWAILNEKVWKNPERIRKCREKLKGRKPSQATLDGYKEFCKTPAKSEAAKKAWRDPEYRAMKSEATRKQMANGGAEHLSKKLKGRVDPRSEDGKERHREAVKVFMSTDRGKENTKKMINAFLSNPDAIRRARENSDKWRASEENAIHCKKIAMLAAAACRKRVRDMTTGVVYDSQRDMAKALGLSDAAITRRVRHGTVERV